MSDKHTPCDYGDCPFGAVGGMDCRNYCGLGVDESGPPDDRPTEFHETDENPYSRCLASKDGFHDWVYRRHNGWLCRCCGTAMPDPPEDHPPV